MAGITGPTSGKLFHVPEEQTRKLARVGGLSLGRGGGPGLLPVLGDGPIQPVRQAIELRQRPTDQVRNRIVLSGIEEQLSRRFGELRQTVQHGEVISALRAGNEVHHQNVPEGDLARAAGPDARVANHLQQFILARNYSWHEPF
jgi:hypothetical protein